MIARLRDALEPDGHTASLFPGFPEVTSPRHELVVVVTDSPKPPPVRLTLTYKALNQAKTIILLVSGKDKAKAVHESFNAPFDPLQHPTQGIQPSQGELVWLLDNSASRNL